MRLPILITTKPMKLILLLIIASTSAMTIALEANLAAEDNWLPYSGTDEKSISHVIIKSAFKSVGVKVKIHSYPYARAQKNVLDGNLDGFFNVSKQPSTQKKFHFGKEPIFKAQASFFYHEKLKFKFSNIKEVPKGTTFVLIRGFEYGKDFEKNKHNFELVYVDSQEQIINMLISNRPAITIMYDEVAKYYLRKISGVEKIEKYIPSHTSNIYVAFNKKNPKSKVLSKKLDQGLRELKKTGKYQELLTF